ncbi:MAG: acyl-CoA desaturase [Myxococcales bacterium]|nr:acyl-CoA desaturase [Myxococcales bacterium]
MNAPSAQPKKPTYSLVKSGPFLLVHLVALVGLVLMPFSWKGLALAVGFYYLRMFGVTAGYHRYFSHRTFRTSRIFQFLLAWLAETSTQKGVLWWAAHHRHHHKTSDKPGDVHSMARDGFFWSHVGWILADTHDKTDEKRISDLTRYPELRWLDRFYLVPVVTLCVALFVAGGWKALFWGYFVSTVMLWHGTFTINSLCHYLGKPRYRTGDESKNSLVLAIVTMGEGWHNNHHYYPRSTAQGFFWWEIDATYAILKLMSFVGIVWDLHVPSDEVRKKNLLATPTPEPHVTPHPLVAEASLSDAE